MTSNPFKERAHKHQSKQPLLLPQKELDRLIANSKSIQDENQKENDRLEERKKRQEATKALSKLIAQKRQPGSELRKQEHAKAAHQELEKEKKIEDRKNFILDLAYKRLFEETDRVKQFKIAKNLSVTLKERDKQVEAKNDIVDLTSKYEAKFLHGMLRDVESHWEEEKEKVEKKKRDKLKNAENWKKQREEKEEKQNQADWERHRDGCIIREAAANYEKELEVAARRQKQKIEEYKINLDHQIDQKQVILDMYSKLDKADDERAKIFNNAKADMKMEHQNIKNELDKKREQKRQYVAMNLRDETCAIEAKERDILQKAILQEEAKYRDQCAMKQAKKEKALKSILDFYEKELASKSEKAYDAKRQGLREKTEIFEHVEEQERVEDAKLQARRNREKEAQHLQLHQIAKRRMDKQAEKLEDVEDYLNHMKSLNREEEIFQKYAQMEIADCEARGIDTRPMRFAARPGIECGNGPLYEKRGNIRPRYYSATAQGDELNHVKRDMNKPDTKSRLGFILH